jgi:hypothetical protein
MTQESIQAELTLVWEEFKGRFKNKDLNDVLERKFAFSIPEQSEILITGINPSYQLNDDKLLRYKYSDIKHRYFTILRKIIPTAINGANIKASYLDLFYYRNTEQAILNDFNKEQQLGVKFLSKQLNVTQKIIEWIAPQVILVMNKGSWKYWEKDPKHTWMGYEVRVINDSLEFGELYEIVGLQNNVVRVTPELIQTSLMGTRVYFSKYLKRVSNANLELIKAEIHSAISEIKFL